MWRSIADWALTLFGMSRQLEEHRATIRELEDRVRDLEEALKLVTQEQRHTRELDATEREKLMLRIENVMKSSERTLPAPRRKK